MSEGEVDEQRGLRASEGGVEARQGALQLVDSLARAQARQAVPAPAAQMDLVEKHIGEMIAVATGHVGERLAESGSCTILLPASRQGLGGRGTQPRFEHARDPPARLAANMVQLGDRGVDASEVEQR